MRTPAPHIGGIAPRKGSTLKSLKWRIWWEVSRDFRQVPPSKIIEWADRGRLIHRHELTDHEGELLAPLIPLAVTGRPRVADRRVRRRGIATRCETTATSYEAAVMLVSLLLRARSA
ncbi:hypothetical protein HEK616_34160 [Streptomyces nigrescens]|uniref:Transposase n=1 Tax=Streptomyces nigrescens TaxID=1920 RepID=A0ABM7ZU78_STRNI|nr:hypothetical protein HEK616_34160 [Streptomyces nigrescens]